MIAAHAPTKSLFLRVPDPLQIRSLIPASKMLARDDYNVALHHTLEATRILRNIGINAPAPISSQYRWPGQFKPLPQQIAMAEFQTLHRRAFNLSEPGTAKTAPALWATDWMMETGRVKRTLICAPLSTVEIVWLKNIFNILLHRKAVLVHTSAGAANLNLDVDFFVLNHDGVKINEIAELIRKNPEIDQIIVDEGDEFRNSQTDKYKSLARIVRPDMRIWWMTGTPCPNEPTDAWAQARIVNPANVPKFFGAFRRMTMMQVSQHRWVPQPNAHKLAFEAMQPAIRFKKSDCLDLPPVTYHDRQCELTAEQKKNYNTMKNAMVAEAKTTRITAVNAADRITKLRQILCGVVKDPETDHYVEIAHKPRVDVLLEGIKSANAKVYVVVPFKGIIHSLARDVSKHYSVEVLNGDVSRHERTRIVKAFKENADPHVLLCHPKVTSHGLDFTEADTLIVYAPIYSNSQWQQVTERFNRPGQTRSMRIIRIGASPLEWQIYRLLDNRKECQDNILNLFKSVTGV